MGWKSVQRKSKTRKKTRLAALVLGLIILLIIIGNLVRATQTLFSPWKLTIPQGKTYLWDGQFNLNVVVREDTGVSLISYSPTEKKLIQIEIPHNLLVDVPAGFGKWQLRSVYELGETESKGRGVELLKKTISALFGVPIDGFLEMEDIEVLRKNLFLSFASISSIKTDLTLWELLRLKMALSSVRFDKVKKIDLSSIWQESTLGDGTAILLVDPLRIDGILNDLADSVLRAEGKSIAVFNATNQAGLATRAARMITNMGGNVIITTNLSKKLDQSGVMGEQSKTRERLQQVFQYDKISQDEEIVSSRAEINVIVGTDFARP